MNNFIKVFLLVLLLLVVSFFLNYIKECKKEGFQTYDECISSGYSKEFCVQTPTSVFGPGICQCQDGSLGRIMPGFRGECICSSRLFF